MNNKEVRLDNMANR